MCDIDLVLTYVPIPGYNNETMSYSHSSCFSVPGSNALLVVNMSPIDRVHSEKLTVSIISIQHSIYLQYVTVGVGASKHVNTISSLDQISADLPWNLFPVPSKQRMIWVTFQS